MENIEESKSYIHMLLLHLSRTLQDDLRVFTWLKSVTGTMDVAEVLHPSFRATSQFSLCLTREWFQLERQHTVLVFCVVFNVSDCVCRAGAAGKKHTCTVIVYYASST